MTDTTPQKKKNPWLKALGIVVAVVPFLWIYWRLNFHSMLAMLPQIAWWTVPMVIVAVLSSMTLQGVRWWLLLCTFSPGIKLTRALAYHFSSIYYSLILPTSAAQEVMRTLFVLRTAGPAVSWGAAWICKISAVLLSLLCSIYGLWSLADAGLPKKAVYSIVVFCVVLVIAFILSFSKRVTAPLRKAASAFIPAGIMKKIELIREGIYQYRTKKKELLLTLFLTAVIQLLLIFCTSLVIKGICGRSFFRECLAYMPLIEIISMSQPITPGGMGVREALVAIMFKHIGLSKEQLGLYVLVIFSSNLLKLTGLIPIAYGHIKQRMQRSGKTDGFSAA